MVDTPASEVVLDRLKAMRNDVYYYRAAQAEPEWMDWVIENWLKLAPSELHRCPFNFTARNKGRPNYIETAWPGAGCWVGILLDTNGRKGFMDLFSFEHRDIWYPGNFVLESDEGWEAFFKEILHLISLPTPELKEYLDGLIEAKVV